MKRQKAADAKATGENDAEAKTQAKRQRTEIKGDVQQEEERVKEVTSFIDRKERLKARRKESTQSIAKAGD